MSWTTKRWRQSDEDTDEYEYGGDVQKLGAMLSHLLESERVVKEQMDVQAKALVGISRKLGDFRTHFTEIREAVDVAIRKEETSSKEFQKLEQCVRALDLDKIREYCRQGESLNVELHKLEQRIGALDTVSAQNVRNVEEHARHVIEGLMDDFGARIGQQVESLDIQIQARCEQYLAQVNESVRQHMKGSIREPSPELLHGAFQGQEEKFKFLAGEGRAQENTGIGKQTVPEMFGKSNHVDKQPQKCNPLVEAYRDFALPDTPDVQRTPFHLENDFELPDTPDLQRTPFRVENFSVGPCVLTSANADDTRNDDQQYSPASSHSVPSPIAKLLNSCQAGHANSNVTISQTDDGSMGWMNGPSGAKSGDGDAIETVKTEVGPHEDFYAATCLEIEPSVCDIDIAVAAAERPLYSHSVVVDHLGSSVDMSEVTPLTSPSSTEKSQGILQEMHSEMTSESETEESVQVRWSGTMAKPPRPVGTCEGNATTNPMNRSPFRLGPRDTCTSTATLREQGFVPRGPSSPSISSVSGSEKLAGSVTPSPTASAAPFAMGVSMPVTRTAGVTRITNAPSSEELSSTSSSESGGDLLLP